MNRALGSSLNPIFSGHGRRQRRHFLYAVSFLISFAVTQAILGLIFYAQDTFQATPRQIGWLTGVFLLTYSVSCLAIQFHLHCFRPGMFIMAATGVLGAAYTGILLATTLEGVFWLTGLSGITLSCFWPPLLAWLSKGLEGAALNRRISGFNVAWSLGAMVGPLTCGYLSEQSVRLPLLSSAGLAFLTTGLIAVLLFQERDEGQPVSAAAAVDPLPAPADDTLYRYPAWVGLLAVFFCIGVASNIFPLVARKQLLFAESLIGLLLFVRVLFNTLVFYLLGRTTFWHFRGWPMLIGQLLGALIMIGLVFTRTPITIGCMLAGLGIAGGLGYVTSIFHSISGSPRRGGRIAIHESIVSIGIVFGSVIGGTVCQAHAISRAYWICAGVSFAALAIQGALLSRIRKSASLARG